MSRNEWKIVLKRVVEEEKDREGKKRRENKNKRGKNIDFG